MTQATGLSEVTKFFFLVTKSWKFWMTQAIGLSEVTKRFFLVTKSWKFWMTKARAGLASIPATSSR